MVYQYMCHSLFVSFLGPGPGAARRGEGRGRVWGGAFPRRIALRAAPFLAQSDLINSYKTIAGTQTRDPTRPGPEARRI